MNIILVFTYDNSWITKYKGGVGWGEWGGWSRVELVGCVSAECGRVRWVGGWVG